MKIANKISVSFLIMAIVFTSFGVLALYITSKKHLVNSIHQHLRTAVESRARHIETLLEEYKAQTMMIADFKSVEEILSSGQNRESISGILKEIMEESRYIKELSVLNLEGIVVASAEEKQIGEDKGSEVDIEKAKEEFYFIDAHLSWCGDKEIGVAGPIRDDRTGKTKGILISGVETVALDNITTDKIGMGETGEIYLVNKDGYMITPSRIKKDTFMKQKIDSTNLEDIFLHQDKSYHEERVHTFNNYSGVKVLGTHELITEMQWILLAEIEAKEALAPLTAMELVFCLILISIPLLVWVIGMYFSRIITKPIHRLQEHAEMIGRGNLDFKTDITTRDEIGQLSRAFNQMTSDLKEKTTSIETLNQEISNHTKTEMALRESEEKYHTLFNNDKNAVFIFESETMNIIDANPSMTAMYGYALKELIGMSCLDLSNEVEKSIKANSAIEEEGKVSVKLRWHKRKDGTAFPVEIDGHAIMLKGKPAQFAIVKDITERMKAEEEHKQMEKQRSTFEKLESLGLLAGGLAHDFNNLLNIITGNMNLCAVREKDPASKKLLDETLEATARAQGLTFQLLTFAKGGEPVKTRVALNSELQKIIPFFLAGAGVEIKFNLAQELCDADVDLNQISQVIQNLVINAKEAMENSGVIEVTTENITDDSGSGFVKISIKDNGPGIPQDVIPKIFDPYFTTKKTGNGLGLAAVYSIVKQHGGSIDWKTETGNGTVFIICLPALKGVKEKQPEPVSAEEKTVKSEGKRRRILVVDDEPQMTKLLETQLDFFGHTAVVANDPVTANRLYRESRAQNSCFDIVIIDLTLRGHKNGIELFKELKEFDPAVKAVVSSGYSQDAVMANFKEHGFCAALPKPYNMDKLSEVLERIFA